MLKRVYLIVEKKWRKNWKSAIEFNSEIKMDIVIVNYNTKYYISYLLFSLYKIVGKKYFNNIVIVDNASTDGSLEILEELDKQQFIQLIANKKQKYHGPALNQGMKYLNQYYKKNDKCTSNYIMILDSDVIVLKKNIISDSLNSMLKNKAAVLGQFQYDMSPLGFPHISTLIINPEKVWNRNIHPFTNDGWPSKYFYHDVRRRGLEIIDFPFRKENYVLHLGRGTLREIFLNNEVGNQHYKWAKEHAEISYYGNNKGEIIFSNFIDLFNAKVSPLNPKNLCNALLDKDDLATEFENILQEISVL